VLEDLPSAIIRALGKQETLGKLTYLPSVFSDTRQTSSLPSVFFLTLGKEESLPSVFVWHSANK